ncbi:MAG TPA: molybdopterin converting factor subunit 1 [Burkholderiales bacterium]|nr:molybdopterin converting factor subunit 1 [Burkholderiales bacterium]
MKIRVLFFARLREQLGSAGEEVEFEQGATLEALRARLAARGEKWSEALKPGRALRAAVNQDMAGPDTVLKAGDEVAFFPPVTGG